MYVATNLQIYVCAMCVAPLSDQNPYKNGCIKKIKYLLLDALVIRITLAIPILIYINAYWVACRSGADNWLRALGCYWD